MTLWLANLAAYSIQLAALVGTGAVIVSLLRVTAPRATLRFWQILFASIVLWPMYQLWATADTSPEVLSGGVVWSLAASSATGMRASVAAIDAGVASLVMGALAAGAAIRLGWLGMGLARLRSIRAASQPARVLASMSVSLQHELDVTADVHFSDAVSSPATIGTLRPLVLLPRRVCDLAPAIQRAVLCHELLHVRRRDWLSSLLEEL